MRCEIRELSSLGPRQLDAWRELAARAMVANPFAEQELALTAARRLHAEDAGLLVVEHGSGWLAALPVRSVSRWRRVPGRFLTSWRHEYCFLGTPLLAPDDPEAVLAAMLRRATHEPGTLAFVLEMVDADGPFGEALAAALEAAGRAPVVVDRYGRASLHRRPENDYLQSTVSSRHRKEMRRTRRLLEAELGPLIVRDRAGDEQAPRRFLELERSGWKGRAGSAMACDPEHARLFEQVCEQWAAAGRLQLLTLESEGRIAAMACNVRTADTVHRFKIAFDDDLSRFSPGMHLEVGGIDAFHNSSASWIDSCADPRNEMINRLWASRRSVQTLVVTARGPRGAAGHHLWRAACAVRDRTKRKATERAHAPDGD
jgi:CelD/BcsL family acetyltransferase involved in cellulose biosynthesis